MDKSKVVIIIAAFFAIGGLIFAILGIKNYLLGAAAKNWPTVKGKVTFTNIATHSHTKSKPHRTYYTYHPSMTYNYSVNGVSYNLSEEKSGYNSKGSAQNYIDSHPVGSEQTIYYNPSLPSQSLTDPSGKASGGMLSAIMGIIFVGIGVFLFSVRNSESLRMSTRY